MNGFSIIEVLLALGLFALLWLTSLMMLEHLQVSYWQHHALLLKLINTTSNS